MPFAATWMNLESVTLPEVRQRRRNIMWHPLNVESKKKWYRWTYEKERDRLRKQTNGCQGERVVRDFGKVMHTATFKIDNQQGSIV